MNKIALTIIGVTLIIVFIIIYNEKTNETPNIDIKEFYFKGHSYLYMKSTSYGSTIINNPDCKKCAKNKH